MAGAGAAWPSPPRAPEGTVARRGEQFLVLAGNEPGEQAAARTPAWRQASANARLVYWEPWSVCRTASARLPRHRSAAARASMTSSERMWSVIAQPARRREARSMTVARYRNSPDSGR
ncbi:hypothetical protein C1J00_19795 [Streptomyces cahuitamycinicus]|uniref:Uncharacterized protein n=1 Tax=Streptomyces cahuitamycinicus TaxID=2070367 RepID=A0A2N8TNE8_9ACTN|nr:hypothetical protein C1J00_19795 [Streptomyces cahuitamycinicus]